MPEGTEIETTETSGTETEDTFAAEVEADLKALDESDPQRKLARAVEADLAELGTGESGGVGAKDQSTQDGGEVKPKPEDEFAEEKSRLALVLKKRGEVFKERESAKAEAETIKAEALKMKADAEAFTRQLQHQAAQIRQFQQALRNDPQRALEALGINPEEFLFGLAKDGTPEGAQAKELRELREKTARFEKWQKDQEEARRKQAEEAQTAQQTQFRKQVETQFLTTAKAKSETVKLALESGLITDSYLINEGDRIADQYREVTGQEASLEDIIEYIDERMSKAYNRIKGPTQAQVPAPKPPAPSAKPGKKTLTADDGSVRTALQPVASPDDSEEERLERAAKAVRIVMEKARARGAEE